MQMVRTKIEKLFYINTSFLIKYSIAKIHLKIHGVVKKLHTTNNNIFIMHRWAFIGKMADNGDVMTSFCQCSHNRMEEMEVTDARMWKQPKNFQTMRFC